MCKEDLSELVGPIVAICGVDCGIQIFDDFDVHVAQVVDVAEKTVDDLVRKLRHFTALLFHASFHDLQKWEEGALT